MVDMMVFRLADLLDVSSAEKLVVLKEEMLVEMTVEKTVGQMAEKKAE